MPKNAPWASEVTARATRSMLELGASTQPALGLLNALRQAGLRAPEDVRVLGFDNIGMYDWAAYELTSFDQNTPEMTRRILVDDAAEKACQGVLETVPKRLVARRTTIGVTSPGR
jgi:DNA-binding LacI/PurR family transcriptional regulator